MIPGWPERQPLLAVIPFPNHQFRNGTNTIIEGMQPGDNAVAFFDLRDDSRHVQRAYMCKSFRLRNEDIGAHGDTVLKWCAITLFVPTECAITVHVLDTRPGFRQILGFTDAKAPGPNTFDALDPTHLF